ncbi:MAG: non-heme chloroperoxidase [Qipengyuania sp.]|jgi:non-heme chloroperoxidase
MPFVTTQDNVEIFYKDWGPKEAQPIVFHHGWPLSSDDWDAQMLFFLSHGFRVVAHDRRGHGRSAQVDHGHDMDHYAADAAAVAAALNLRNAVISAIRPAAAKWRATSRAMASPRGAWPKRCSSPRSRR